MTRLLIPGGVYCDALPSGAYVCQRPGQSFVTHLGEVPFPWANSLYVRCTEVGGWKFAAQSSLLPETLEYRDGGWHPIPLAACGVNPVIYDLAGQLHVSDCGPAIGSQGWRYVDRVTGSLVTGDATLGSSFGLSEWTDLGDSLYIGQCGTARGCALWDGATLRMIEAGDAWFIRAHRDGDQVSIAMVREQKTGQPSILLWLTVAELRAMPAVVPDAPPPFVFAPFNHPVLVCPFKDPNGESGALAEIVVNQNIQAVHRQYFTAEDSLVGPFLGELIGIYSESPDPTVTIGIAAGLKTRLLWCHDSDTPWTLPAGLRTWDIPAVEFYWYKGKGETLAQAVARWQRDEAAMLVAWPGDCAVVPQFYCMGGAPPDEVLTVAEVLQALAHLTALVNRSPRIKIVAPFSFQRANGIVAHPELRAAFESLKAATPGRPIFLPIDPPPIKEPPMNALPVSPDIWQNVEYPQVLAARLARVAREGLTWQETPQWAIFQTMVRYGLAGVSDTNRVLVPVALATMLKNEDPGAVVPP